VTNKVWLITRISHEAPVFCTVASSLEAALQWLKVDEERGLAENPYYYRLGSFNKIHDDLYHVPYTMKEFSASGRWYYEIKQIGVFSYVMEVESITT
jgi:hypothetical protein